jgi:hypothetical protein
LRFKDTLGNFHEHKFPGHAEEKWDDDAWVASLNKWRYQTISRKFKYDPSIVRGHRGKWTMAEKVFLKDQLQKKVEQNGDRLLVEDWKDVAKAHKEKFVGTVVKKGEELLHGTAVRDYTITERTHVAIRAAFEKMQDLTEMVAEMVAEYTDDESGDEPEDDVVMTNAIEEEHGGELEHHLEDPSDDEDDGQRPASNQTGAILVAGAC